MADVATWLASVNNTIQPSRLAWADTNRGRVYKWLPPARRLAEVRDSDIVMAFVLPPVPTPQPLQTPSATPPKGAAATPPAPRTTRRGMLRSRRAVLRYRTRLRDCGSPHTAGVIQLLTRVAGTLVGDPVLVSLYVLSGTHGVLPSPSKLRRHVAERLQRLVSTNAAHECPYDLNLLALHGACPSASLVPRTAHD